MFAFYWTFVKPIRSRHSFKVPSADCWNLLDIRVWSRLKQAICYAVPAKKFIFEDVLLPSSLLVCKIEAVMSWIRRFACVCFLLLHHELMFRSQGSTRISRGRRDGCDLEQAWHVPEEHLRDELRTRRTTPFLPVTSELVGKSVRLVRSVIRTARIQGTTADEQDDDRISVAYVEFVMPGLVMRSAQWRTLAHDSQHHASG